MPPKIITPHNTLIEHTASQFACVFYEAGRNTGMTSKYKTPQAFAKKYLERFIPLAVHHLLEMLKPTSNCTAEAREEIWDAMQERLKDPELLKYMPDPDVAAVAQRIYEEEKLKVVVINTKPLEKPNILLNMVKPPLAIRH